MTLFEKIQNFLNQNNIEYTIKEHEPVRTSEEAARIRGNKPEEGAKALLFWADGEPAQLVIQGNLRVDKEKFKQKFDIKKLKMVSADEVKEISSVEPGAVPPFGNLFSPPIRVYCNEGFSDKIEFNAGNHGISIQMKYQDWLDLVNPIIADYGERA